LNYKAGGKYIIFSEYRLVEIETEIAFQEQTIKDLNDVLCEQQQQAPKKTKEFLNV